jgi:hypothetical protein
VVYGVRLTCPFRTTSCSPTNDRDSKCGAEESGKEKAPLLAPPLVSWFL